MEIGIQFYTLRDHCKNLDDFAETLKKVSDIGYKNVQISGFCDYEPEWLKENLDKNGLKCVITKTNIVTAKHIMILGHRRGIRLQAIGRNVGQHALQVILLQLLCQPLGVVGAGSGDLHGLVADIRNLAERQGKIIKGLALIADGIELRADLHGYILLTF